MKKIFFLLLVTTTLWGNSIGQNYDDGFISSHLSVNTGDARFTSFVNEFRSGISRVRNRELTSADGIAVYYGIDIRNYPRLDQVVTGARWTSYNGDYSASFLTDVKEAVDKLSYQYDNIGQFRSELLGIALSRVPSAKESEVLALMDIAIQEVTKEFLSQDAAYLNSVLQNSGQTINTDIDFNLTDRVNLSSALCISDYNLPRWIKCGLGVIGSAILGGITGAGYGAKVGVIFGPGGAALGAVIGGIGGVIGGAFTGAASFCD